MMHTTNSIRIPSGVVSNGDYSIPRGCYFNFLTAEDAMVYNSKQYVASKQLHTLHLVELKGTFEPGWSFELLPPDCFWLQFQFFGHSEPYPTANTALSNNEYRGFYSTGQRLHIRLKSGRTALVLLGVQVEDKKLFTSEWPLLAEKHTAGQRSFSAIQMGYRVKQFFEKIEQRTATPYSLYSKLNYYFCQLIDIYHQDLKDKARSLHKEDIAIYHQALAYIHAHYMEENINRDSIAAQLGVSVRKLYRVFEDKHNTIHGAIQTIRLYKGRELLRETDISVDGIAFQLQFSSAKYFYRQYMQLFGHSPSHERKRHRKKKR